MTKRTFIKIFDAALKANSARFSAKLRQDMKDEKNLFYTLQGDRRIEKILARNSDRRSELVSPLSCGKRNINIDKHSTA